MYRFIELIYNIMVGFLSVVGIILMGCLFYLAYELIFMAL